MRGSSLTLDFSLFLFLDETLEALKAQKREIVSDFLISLRFQ